jgi:hypothetical protein
VARPRLHSLHRRGLTWRRFRAGQARAASRHSPVRAANWNDLLRRFLGLRPLWKEASVAQPTETAIVTRAYELWQKAGQPEGKDEEFYRLAEQELRNDDKSSTLRTPDNL